MIIIIIIIISIKKRVFGEEVNITTEGQRHLGGLLFGTRQLLQTSSDFALQIQGEDIERVMKFNYLGTT